MKTLQVAKNFELGEFVPEEIHDKYKSASTRFVVPTLFTMAQGVKDFYDGKRITINNWLWGGGRNYSGFRPADVSVGANNSAHKRGMAIDVVVEGVDSAQVYKDITSNQAYFMSLGVTSIESGTDGWTHLSCEYYPNLREIVVIPFYKGGK